MSDTILLIEDNPEMRENTSELLELSGYRVLTAANGREGLDLLVKNTPDLILCDIMMPELDGYGVLQAIQNKPELTGIPFVFLTAKTEKKDFRVGMDLGADDYLDKPFTGTDLLRVVSARLQKSKQLKKKFANSVEGLNEFLQEAKSMEDLSTISDQRIEKKYKKGQFIFMEGDSPGFIYFIVSGKVKVFKSNDWGKDYITEIHKEGDFFGYLPLLEGTPYKETAQPIEPVTIIQIPKDEFFQLVYSNPEVSMQFIKLMSNNLAEAEERLLKLAYDTSRKRVAEALLFVSKKYESEADSTPDIPLNRENLSAIAGIAMESVSRTLKDLKEEGLIETNKRTVRILNYEKLENLKY